MLWKAKNFAISRSPSFSSNMLFAELVEVQPTFPQKFKDDDERRNVSLNRAVTFTFIYKVLSVMYYFYYQIIISRKNTKQRETNFEASLRASFVYL
ncbi:hypothetical protein RCL_jg21145.t1 [Rhizophagus clarus]|uniref:Uncharacterized protein n=1 Tax=Rhizophagus clarus TaxID=94130 RepID=A0A8H3LUY3_9GLOM|nr:hypothetical protein RCL_jg21145.t1 [Rhizophagus clarus]